MVAGLVERPRLLALLERQDPVTLICAPAGSGKSALLSSWLAAAEAPVAHVAVERDESDATRFWTLVTDALRSSGAVTQDSALATLAPAPLGGQDELLDRLHAGLAGLDGPVVLVIDDLHHLASDEALRDLDRLLAKAPPQLRTVLATRRDPPLALHRLRLAGGLTEIRAADLEFTADEAAALIDGAGVTLAPGDLARLNDRTEGWAAGLRLAAMSLARHDAPSRFVAEFSGSERTIADYLLGEVLSTQPPEIRHLLLRTCVLERVNGPLADLLTGRDDGTRLLHELEQANAFVVALDVGRTWFRYHHLLADLLRLELRREAAGEIEQLHRTAARWHADQGNAIEATRHAQLGGDIELATELLGRHWVHMVLDGEEGTVRALLTGLPATLAETDAEIATITALDRLAESRWAEADTLLAAAEQSLDSVPSDRRRRTETALATVQLFRARRLGDLDTVVDGAAARLHLDDPEVAALGLMNLGIAEAWTLRLDDAHGHLQQGLELARTAGRPYVEIGCITALAVVANLTHRLDDAETLCREAIARAERHGWATQANFAAAYVTLGAVMIDHGMVPEAQEWLARADPILAGAPEPAASVGLRHTQGMVAVASGRLPDALAAFREGERLTTQLRAPHFLAIVERHWQLRVQVAMGETAPVHDALADADDAALWRNLRARLHLAEGDHAAVAEAVAPVLTGEAFIYHPAFEIEACLLDAVARLRLGEEDASERSLERALALGEPQNRVFMFLTIPGVDEALARHPLHRTAHAAHLKRLRDGVGPAKPPAALAEPLSDRELAVLRFLPTNLSASEIGNELFLSVHTVKTHMRKLYAKLDVHTRAEAVEKGRELGLLGSFTRIV
ncbi:MAG TPA: LuxR C-terminal-related transcriptional regulator [Solirubrobacteraceae bacterium]|nr:LuxR C-terminal-related transcriptional regulator [Solirubrobacteraceae bacterium]